MFTEGNTELGEQTVTLWTAIEFMFLCFYVCLKNVLLNF